MPITDPSKIICVKVSTNMVTLHTDLQASMRATLVATDELHSVVILREDNGNDCVVLYTYEDLSP